MLLSLQKSFEHQNFNERHSLQELQNEKKWELKSRFVLRRQHVTFYFFMLQCSHVHLRALGSFKGVKTNFGLF